MACNYEAIRRNNKRRWGTHIGNLGQLILACLYADRTHFIFELLQNAEDALTRRIGWQGPRSMKFHLTKKMLRVSHFGQPFDKEDVLGICGIAQSTKDLTEIGQFGIGFKSVYQFTDRPEIHSGSEAFAIENFVWPSAVARIDHDPQETVIIIPLKETDESGHDEIARGLGKLGASALLFLRQIDEIQWIVEGDRMGHYLRQSKKIGKGARRVTVIGEEQGQPDFAEEWLVISQAVIKDGVDAGNVELAFLLETENDSKRDRIQRVKHSPLVVFFPTVLETHLGFLVQGPYRTTPSRDNVPSSDNWNQHLVNETASLLQKALFWLRDHDLLGSAALQCLPLDPERFGESGMFTPLYDATKAVLSTEPLLPRFDTGHVAALDARLGRTQEIRELFTPTQLATLYGREDELVWLSGEITVDRTPRLRSYLVRELNIGELTPETVIPRLNQDFLEAQSDNWIRKLYEFLNGQPRLRSRLDGLPLVRIADGSHVRPQSDSQARAFLPSSVQTSFPVVRDVVCNTEKSLNFLKSLGLTQPDPVDDVIRNLLPKYQEHEINVSDAEYEADVGRIVNAYRTDSKEQREKLLRALRDSAFVMAIDAGNGLQSLSKPDEVYLGSRRLRELFSGVEGVLLVDTSYSCLRGKDSRDLLEACAVTRHICPISCDALVGREQLRKIRTQAGCKNMSSDEPIRDRTLRGLDGLLAHLGRCNPDSRSRKAQLLWYALDELQERRGTWTFTTKYRWFYYSRHQATLDVRFVRQLNESAWVPDGNGQLQRPSSVLFETLGWKSNPFLLSRIRFKPPILDQLAKEAGFEPGILDLLSNLGVTKVADLRERLGIRNEHRSHARDDPSDVEDAVASLLGNTARPSPAVSDLGGAKHVTAETSGSSGTRGGISPRGKQTAQGTSRRPFISYVGTHLKNEDADPDGLDYADRMALEAKAIRYIRSVEPTWLPTPKNNPGFDLFKVGPDEHPMEWCEVKAMTGELTERSVGLSRAQFDFARKHGDAYWLYIVERTGMDSARIIRIQDPYGNARTFTFDHGWRDIAKLDSKPLCGEE